jgi:hypothetical protein
MYNFRNSKHNGCVSRESITENQIGWVKSLHEHGKFVVPPGHKSPYAPHGIRYSGRTTALALYGDDLVDSGIKRNIIWVDPLRMDKDDFTCSKIDWDSIFLVDNTQCAPYVVDLRVHPEWTEPFKNTVFGRSGDDSSRLYNRFYFSERFKEFGCQYVGYSRL